MLPCGNAVSSPNPTSIPPSTPSALWAAATLAANCRLGHALPQGGERGLVGGDRDVVGALHQRDLRRRLDDAAAGGDRVGTDVLERGRRPADHVEEEEAHALLDADAPGRDAAVLQDLGHRLSRVLVLLPRADVGAEADQFASAPLLELGAHPGDLAARGDHGREHPLAAAPAHAGEVEQARARLEVEGVDSVVHHQRARLLDAAPPLVVGDRHDAAQHRRERTDRWRHVRPLRAAGLRRFNP